MMPSGPRSPLQRKSRSGVPAPGQRALRIDASRATAGTATDPATLEGLRLLRAFKQIEDPSLRRRALEFVEDLSRR
jgi:hypothetical protein